MILIEFKVPSTRFALARKLSNPHDRIYDVEAIEERGYGAENK